MSGLPPAVCFGWSLFLGIAAVASPSSILKLICTALIILLACLTQRSLEALKSFVVCTFSVIVPLIVIHSFLNPSFPETYKILGAFAFRKAGYAHSLSVSGGLTCLLMSAVLWRHVDARRLLDWLVSLRLPLSIMMIFAQSISVLFRIRSRSGKVLVAQQARGIPTGPGLFTRLRALPSVILPVTLATLGEVDLRAACLSSRGFGTGRMTVLADPRPTCVELMLSIIPWILWTVWLVSYS